MSCAVWYHSDRPIHHFITVFTFNQLRIWCGVNYGMLFSMHSRLGCPSLSVSHDRQAKTVTSSMIYDNKPPNFCIQIFAMLLSSDRRDGPSTGFTRRFRPKDFEDSSKLKFPFLVHFIVWIKVRMLSGSVGFFKLGHNRWIYIGY